MSSLLIVGAKGFAKELLVAVRESQPTRQLVFFDDVSPDSPEMLFGLFPILRSREAVREHFKSFGANFAVGVGDPVIRESLFRSFEEIGGQPETIISPTSLVGDFGNVIGSGTCVLSGAVIESSNVIGTGVLLHVGSFVSHDVEIGDFCEISPRANLLGGVRIGKRCRIGTNATILPGRRLGDNVTVGAGAVVTRDIPSGLTVKGIPAK